MRILVSGGQARPLSRRLFLEGKDSRRASAGQKPRDELERAVRSLFGSKMEIDWIQRFTGCPLGAIEPLKSLAFNHF
jgi:hypothetical protein